MFYVGSTNNLDRRLLEHQNKLSNFLHKFSDIELVYHEEFDSRENAWKREKQLKGWSNAKKKALIEGDFARVKILAKRH